MNNIQKRFLLFICGCILTRSLFVIIAKEYVNFLPVMGAMAFIPAIGFLYIYLTNSRKTGDEVFGSNIWWNDLRPIHGILYIIFGFMAINKNPIAWTVLLLDVLIGLGAFLYFHYNEGNFEKLF